MKFYSGLFIAGLFTGALASCGINICLNWKVSLNTLTLKCKVHNLRFSVKFIDPSNEQVALCVQPLPSVECRLNQKFKGRTILQDIKTQETILKITGTIDKSVNGNWTCHHGTNTDTATIEVTVFDSKDQIKATNGKTDGLIPFDNTQTISRNQGCLERTVLYGMCTYSVSMLCYILLLKVQTRRLGRLDCIHKHISALYRSVSLVICSIAFLVVCLVVGILGNSDDDCLAQYILLGLGIIGGLCIGVALIKIEVPPKKSTEPTNTSLNQNNQTENRQDTSRDVEEGDTEPKVINRLLESN